MRVVRAFALGCVAMGVVAYTVALAIGVVAHVSGWASLRVAAGPIVLIAVERTSSSVATTLGPGLLLVGVVGGMLNAFAASLLTRRGD